MSEATLTLTPVAVSAAGAAELLGISESHLFNLIKQGKFGPSATRIGRAVRYDRQEVTDWFKAGCPARHRWHAMHEQSGSW